MFITNRLYIHKVDYRYFSEDLKEAIKEKFIFRIKDPNVCQLRNRGIACDYVAKHGRNICLKCESAVRRVYAVRKTPNYFALERGDMGLIKELFKGHRITDRSKFPPRKQDFKFLWDKLSDQEKAAIQKKAAEQWLQEKYGQIQAPPRSGKTVLAVAISSYIPTKVIVLAHQKELLGQFYGTYQNFTDIEDTNIAINPKIKMVDKYDVCLFTYQQFISHAGKKKFDQIKRKFGFLVVDEAHRAPAKMFSEVVGGLHARYRLGLSATPTRKDGMHIKNERVIGPVTVGALSEQLPCKVSVVYTQMSLPDFSRWTTFVNRLSTHPRRNGMLIDYLEKDLKAGHRVVIPVDRVNHVLELKRLIAGLDGNYKVGIVTGKTKAPEREKVINDAKTGKLDVIVATRKIIYLGLDIPPFSCIYSVIPVANKENIYQEISRIRTPYKDKQYPMIRYFLDDVGAAHACYKIAKDLFTELNFNISGDSEISSVGYGMQDW